MNLELINLKLYCDKKKLDNIIYKPISKKECKIIFKSTEKYFLEFNINIKFVNYTEITYYNSTVKYESFPIEGLIISCEIDSTKNLEISISPLDLCANIIIKKKIEIPYNIINFTNISWDNIFIINLVRRNDRKEEMIKKLAKANIHKYKFIEAFDGLDPEINNKFIELKKKKNINIVSSGHFACLLSHYKAISLAKLLNYKNIMILEDDIIFSDNFIKKMKNINVPDFDLLYLGGIISKKKIFYNDWGYSNNIMCTFGYILSSNLYDEVLKKFEKLDDYADYIFSKHFQSYPEYKTIILNDYIVSDFSSSDTSNKSKKLIKRLEYTIKNFK